MIRSDPSILQTRSRRTGFAAIYTVIMLIALCGIVSLGVDLGRVQLAKSELQTAADAAVRAAATALATSASQARTNAADVAAANLCDGSPVVLDTSADIEFGDWDTESRAFTPLSGSAQDSASAVRITARRIAARSTAIPLAFARLVGRSTCDIHASAVATVTKGAGNGFIGLNGVTMKNGDLVASYDSRRLLHPNPASCGSRGLLASNGQISAGKARILGDVQLGPSGSISGSPLITGQTKRLPAALPTPASPPWTPAPNPGGISQNYTVNRTTLLPGGTYYFTSLTIDGTLAFSGPATLYVNGDIALDGSLLAADWVPSNLKIHQLGSSRTFGDRKSNGMVVVARIEAPGTDFVAKNNAQIMGSATFDTMTMKNGVAMFYDEAGGSASGGVTISVVK